MPRRVQDIVPGSHRSIRDIPVEHPEMERRTSTAHPKSSPLLKRMNDLASDKKHSAKKSKEESHAREAETVIVDEEHKVTMHKMVMDPPSHHKTKRKRGVLRWFIFSILIVALVAGAGYYASIYFSRATFTIIPKSIPVAVNGTYVATYAGEGTAMQPGVLYYETVSISSTASTSVEASDGPTISTKAQGKVTIYNNYGENSQQLIAGTRITNSSGKVYRLTGSVVVPGKNGALAGSIQASIVADQPGAAYNISKGQGVDDFKFLGYQGSDKYNAFYARVASEITGGYEGKKKTVDSSTLASTTAALKSYIIDDLKGRAANALENDAITYDTLNIISFSEPNLGGTDPSKAEVSLTGTMVAITFKKGNLAERLAGSKTISNFGSFAYETPGLESLKISIANQKDFSPDRKTALLVKGSGNFNVKGVIPVEEIRKKLAGLPLGSFQQILEDYGPVIQSGSGELIPPWAKVPNDIDRISVVVK